MKIKRSYLLIALLWLGMFPAKGQLCDSTINVHLVRVGMGGFIPMGDLAKRFGANGSVEGSYIFKTKTNWQLGVVGSYLFGATVKEADAILDNLTASNGEIIDATGGMALLGTYERGFSFFGNVGKLYPLKNSCPNNGFLVMGGVGYLTHHMRAEVYMNLAPQLFGGYEKGYDRLTGGPAYSLFVGYQNVDKGNIFNYYVGVSFMHALTKPLRNYQFDLMGPEPNHLRHDLLLGVTFGWMLPFYQKSTSSYYYY